MVKPVRIVIIHNLLLILAIGIAYLVNVNKFLTNFSLQITAIVVLTYLGLQFASKKLQISKDKKVLAEMFLLSLAVYLIIFSTGGLNSPLFFLTYFLLFGISLLFEPSAAFSLTIISTAFLLVGNQNKTLSDFLSLASLFLITPMALIFGSQYLKLLQNEEKIKILTKEEKGLAKEVSIQEKEVKGWTSGEFRQSLIKIWEAVESLASDPTCQDKHRHKLQEISNHLSNLLQSGEKMKKKIAE